MTRPGPIILSLAALAAMAGRPTAARADIEGECKSQQCPAGSPHEYEMISCDTPGCYCYDTCGSSSGSSGTTGTGGNLIAGMAMAVAQGIYYTVGVFVFPALLIDIHTSPAKIKEAQAAAAKAWRDHRRAIAALEKRGRDVTRMEAQLLAFERLLEAREGDPRHAAAGFDWGADEFRDALGDRKPAERPRLVPSLDFQCNQARLLITNHAGGPIAGFTDVPDMLSKCQGRYGDAILADDKAELDCHLQDEEGKAVHCPADHPILNMCSGECFRDTDFRGGKLEGMRCTSSTDCAVSSP